MFKFVIKYLGFLKFVPGLAHVYDGMLRMQSVVLKPELLVWIDEIETEVSGWQNIRVFTHKYGGLQFNCGNREMGHIHSNGLLDMLLNRNIKAQLMAEDARIKDHHSFKNSGWISVYMKEKADKDLAVRLFKIACDLKTKELNNLNIS
ncbi:luciferase family protein [Mucilaginibacter lutimaris]|uniref:Luciferase family protein n=1 Tax=Mucilaginibacter lutimaris TaxID=931629 RepID=A0ABW2ZIG2_9SPHI